MAAEPSSNPMMNRQESLAPGSVHDTHFYDPNAAEAQIVAMFETVPAAKMAQEQLHAARVPAERSLLIQRAPADAQGHVPPGAVPSALGDGHVDEGGIWARLRRLMLPDDEPQGYAEGLRRGHAVLVVWPPETLRLRCVEILEACGPVDFDARLEAWRSAGWEALAEERAAHAAPAGYARGAENPGGSNAAGREADLTGYATMQEPATGARWQRAAHAGRVRSYVSGKVPEA